MKNKERHNISISKTTWELAKNNADSLELSVSSYITMLIKNDKWELNKWNK